MPGTMSLPSAPEVDNRERVQHLRPRGWLSRRGRAPWRQERPTHNRPVAPKSEAPPNGPYETPAPTTRCAALTAALQLPGRRMITDAPGLRCSRRHVATVGARPC